MLGHFYSEDYIKQIAEVTSSSILRFQSQNLCLNLFLKEVYTGFFVVNSSPFFGSHGGLHSIPDTSPETSSASINMTESDYCEVLKELDRYKILSINIVENPFAPKFVKEQNQILIDKLAIYQGLTYKKIERLGFVKEIIPEANFEDLMSSYHQKTRNCIRKFLNTELNVQFIRPENAIIWSKTIIDLFKIHSKSMHLKGGNPKSMEYFLGLSNHYENERLMLAAIRDDKSNLIAAILFFRFGETLEYWTPVITDDGKKINAMHGLIHETFTMMSKSDLRFMNFGGTWPSQLNLARFKSRFGSSISNYNYHNFSNTLQIKEHDLTFLLRQNPYYYFWEY